jgi:hypothetical protein
VLVKTTSRFVKVMGFAGVVCSLAALALSGCAAKEEPLTEKLPPKVQRENGPSAGATATTTKVTPPTNN